MSSTLSQGADQQVQVKRFWDWGGPLEVSGDHMAGLLRVMAGAMYSKMSFKDLQAIGGKNPQRGMWNGHSLLVLMG